MNAIGIENLRCLSDTGLIKLKPITILLGQNSTGKSTFLRALPLLRQSVESRTMGPLLWAGRFVDFGSFHEAIRSDTDKPEIIFRFQFTIPKNWNSERTNSNKPSPAFLEDLDILLTLKVFGETLQGMTRTKECVLSFAEHKLRIEFESDGKVTTFEINDLDVLTLNNHQYYSELIGNLIPSIDKDFFNSMSLHLFSEIDKYEYVHGKRDDIVQNLALGSSEAMLANIQKNLSSTSTSTSTNNLWTINSESFQRLKNMIIANETENLLLAADEYLTQFASHIYYIAPLRATAERYYRIQDFAVDEVDSQGRNLAMFLQHLTDEERHQFAAWTEKYFAIAPEVQSVGGQFSLKLKERGGNTAFNIADIGFGFCQVLPILMELWRILSRSPHASLSSKQFRFHQRQENSSPVRQQVIFAIEQPELHLHPRLQALLADALLSAISAARCVNLELRLVIETHSETLINRLGHRIDNGDVKRQDINIVVFEKEHANAPAQIRVVEYDDEGFLTNWPFGFFEPEMI
jgi:AAA15 family ATPase/GTPase